MPRETRHSRTARASLLASTFALAFLSISSAGAVEVIAESSQSASVHAFIGVNVLTMEEGLQAPLNDHTVLVRRGVITDLGPRGTVDVPEEALKIEPREAFLAPGLADMHVHLEYFDEPHVLKAFLANGVTTVRNMDGRDRILAWRAQTAAGELIGPRIVTAGPIIDGDPPLRDDNLAVGSPRLAREVVERQHRDGHDFIKVYTNLDADTHAAVLEAAADQGLPVAGHVPRDMSLTEVLHSGQLTIEHFDGYGDAIEAIDSPHRNQWHWSKLYLAMPADERAIRAAAAATADAGVWNVPTLGQQEAIAPPEVMRSWLAEPIMRYVPEELRAHWAPENRDPYTRQLLQALNETDLEALKRGTVNRARLLRALKAAGGGVLVGTDTPNPFVVPGFSVHKELELFVEAGLSPAAALAAATREPARFLGMEGEFGTIAVGHEADLVLFDDNPLVDIENTRSILGVMRTGRWFSRLELDALLSDVENAFRRH